MIKELNLAKHDLKETLVNMFTTHSHENNGVYIINVDTGNYLDDIKSFFAEHGEGYVDENVDPVKPVIIDQLPEYVSGNKLRIFYYSILECFWTPYEKTWSDEQLLKQISVLLKYCKVKLLIFSEYKRFIKDSDISLFKQIAEVSGTSVIAVKSIDGIVNGEQSEWFDANTVFPDKDGIYNCRVINGDRQFEAKRKWLKVRWFGGCRPFSDNDQVIAWQHLV